MQSGGKMSDVNGFIPESMTEKAIGMPGYELLQVID
jgi:hypothetical protein